MDGAAVDMDGKARHAGAAERGASATSNNSEPFAVDQGFRGEKRAIVAEGCAGAGVAYKSDLYMT
jgi:hypothetical protein